jgi:hypothetical protein
MRLNTIMVAMMIMSKSSWLESLWNSPDKLSALVTRANWGIAFALLLSFVLTVLVIKAGGRRDTLQAKMIADTNLLAAQANERAGKLEKEAAELESKNLALEVAIAPRRLSDRQERELAELSRFAGRIVGIKSYSSDTEGFILASQITDALAKSHLRIEDNRLTMQPAGSVLLGVTVEGQDEALVDELRRILFLDGHLISQASMSMPNRGGVSFTVGFGVMTGAEPPNATVTIGAKPIK